MRNKPKVKYALVPILAILVGCEPSNPPPEKESGDEPQMPIVPPSPHQSEAHALNCVPVAKIHKRDNINQISIWREGKTVGLASRLNKELCAGDKVIVPNTLDQVKIEYYSYPPKEVRLSAGDSYPVEALSDPCGVLCKLTENIKGLAEQLTTGEQESGQRR